MTTRPRRPRGAARSDRPITLDLVREALGFIPPDVTHDDRVRLAFAVWDGVGDAGAATWLDWAAQRSHADPAEDRSTWKSASKPGRVKVGTLFGIAKDHGFRFPEADADAPAPDPAALAAAKAERERRHQAEEAEYRRRADDAAKWARELWADGQAVQPGAAPYLTRKGVQAHGVRCLPDGTLLVPMRNAAGELQNVQRIAPVKPECDQPEKRFLPGGRKSGLWHLIGELAPPAAEPVESGEAAPSADACTAPADPAAAAPPVLLLAEGYATGASLHEATGWPVAVCFDAGNLKPCALALQGLHPVALLLVCGDDDRGTEARTGTNPGRVKGTAAARAVRAAGGRAGLVLPEGLPDGATDFNDLAAHAGAAAVRDQVQAAALALLAGASCAASAEPADTDATDADVPADMSAGPLGADPPPADADAPATAAKRAKGRKSSRPRPPEDGDGSERDGGADLPGGFDRFRVDESGVWFTPPAGDDGTTGSARRVCDRLEVLALARDSNDKGGALLLDFDSQFGRGRRWLMPLAMLAGDGAAYRGELLDMGFMTPADNNRRRWLTEYLQTRRPADRVRLVDRVGWQGRAYVLPRETLTQSDADPGERLMFHSEAPAEDAFAQRGSAAQWQERIGRLCVGNSRLLFAASVALAGPVLAWVPGMESGGFHLRGDSSCGKTTALRVAASVWGGRDYLQRWRATDNGLEAQAAQHSDCVLVLDELGQLDAKVAGESAYMLANGQGKARAGRNGGARPRLSWRLLWLSAGEIPLAQHMAEAGKRIRAGQELRMVDMPADAGAGLGLFDTVHDHEGGAALAEHLAAACATTHGATGRAWLEWLVAHCDSWPKALRDDVDTLTLRFVPDTADGQVKRAGRRFALVAAAGELATRQGLTGWPEGAATEGVKRCFLAWVNARPAGFGSSERTEALRQVRAWLEKNGDALLTWWHRAMDDHKPNTALRAGFKRMIDEAGQPVKYDSADDYCDARAPAGERSADAHLVEYMILPEAFRNEVCKGLDAPFVAKVLKDAGHLKTDRDRLTHKLRAPGMGNTPLFHVLPSVFDAAGAED
ncbi:MAG TPA: DUF927 domain-containing protein [Burkholderiaceae bacterium]|nr:DUF927 domain-containing protein [Burkholderiaceae bacterium]HNG77918.1 DUF927 domain-containing protein [Burkholderiaceae bacterium]